MQLCDSLSYYGTVQLSIKICMCLELLVLQHFTINDDYTRYKISCVWFLDIRILTCQIILILITSILFVCIPEYWRTDDSDFTPMLLAHT